MTNWQQAYDLLNAAMAEGRGKGATVWFETARDRERCRTAVYSRKASEKRKSRTLFAPSDPEYDTHPWGEVEVVRLNSGEDWEGSKWGLWIGRAKPTPPIAGGKTLDQARRGC